MASHSIAEAKNHLSELIDRALEGEAIVLTRHGRPVIEFKPVGQQGRPMTVADYWYQVRRNARTAPRTYHLTVVVVHLTVHCPTLVLHPRALEKAGYQRCWAGELESDDPSDEGPMYLYRLDGRGPEQV